MRSNETEALVNWVNNISFVIKSKCLTLRIDIGHLVMYYPNYLNILEPMGEIEVSMYYFQEDPELEAMSCYILHSC